MTRVVAAYSDWRRDEFHSKSELSPEFAHRFYVYILGNETTGKLAISMTQDLETRVINQKSNLHPRDYTSVHALHCLVHIETYSDICDAIERYEHLRGMDADSLSWLVESVNPDWHDLFHASDTDQSRA